MITESGTEPTTPAEGQSPMRVLGVDRLDVVMPGFCACCAAPAASSRSERRGATQELIVPYCVRCLRHASAATTRTLAAGVGSCLVAATLALALPLAWPAASLVVHTLVVVAGACLPLLLRAWPQRPEPGHAAAERAVWWLADGRLACAQPRFAEAIAAQLSAVPAESAPRKEPRFAAWLVVGPLVALIGAPSGWFFHHPLVRVLNLTDGRLTVQVDGRQVLSLEPSSTENPTAGAEIRMPSGEHELTSVMQDGSAVSAKVALESGATHLFAPRSDRRCFWLEETRYGREQGASEVLPLGGEARFWVLPRQVDTWFSPNPPPAAPDRRSSGGVLVALRQAPCAQAPASARP